VGATGLLRNRHKLKSLQCPDNLVRSRLIRSWEQVVQPQLRLLLDLGAEGRFLYDVAPHSLFTGGIQLDVRAFLDELAPAGAPAPQADEHSHHDSHHA
jgi:hypothetical protein